MGLDIFKAMTISYQILISKVYFCEVYPTYASLLFKYNESAIIVVAT